MSEMNEEFDKAKAMLELLCELDAGKQSAEKKGYTSSEDVRQYLMKLHQDTIKE
ncbi:MAG: hypothetical protein J5589_12890 [Firmicutes bacterium]|nr:hypothetical protein [Bacillota bacterium]